MSSDALVLPAQQQLSDPVSDLSSYSTARVHWRRLGSGCGPKSTQASPHAATRSAITIVLHCSSILAHRMHL